MPQSDTMPQYAPATMKRIPTKLAIRNEEPQTDTVNVMYDPRIIRGNTYSAKILSASLKQSMILKRQPRNLSPIKMRKSYSNERVSTPPPVIGRMHMNLQTETFLEELSDRPIEKDAETQTHLFLDRPPSPLFIPIKSGIDTSTQILPGELFDFDLEVEPLLEVIVGKTIQSAMLEVMQEEELESLRIQQSEYEAIRNSELAEVKRLEAEALRRHQEKERRISQAKRRIEERRVLHEKVAAKKLAKVLWEELQTETFRALEREGHFYDPLMKEIQELFLPDLINGVKNRVEMMNKAQSMLTHLTNAALTRIAEVGEVYLKQREEEELLERERQRLIELETERRNEERKKIVEAAEGAARAKRDAELIEENSEEVGGEDESDD